MILLLGGTSETPKIANLLAKNNCKVLISNLTDSPVNWDLNSSIRLRHGALDVNSMCDLIAEQDILAIVDAAHPYAEELHSNAIEACTQMNVPYYRYERPCVNYAGYDVEFADDHQKAAAITFRFGHCALLTTGTKNLKPYVEIAQETDSKLYVRILPCKESIDICKKYAIDNDHIIAQRGPFTTQQNIELIKK
ncbi:MAG: precorrin-6A/cobalt-precorrin-6A reductase, partial [Planctomycetota bacterium]